MAESRLDALNEMLARGSRDPFVWYARAMELRSLGRHVDALAAYDDVAREFPEYLPVYLMAGQVAFELGQPERALSLLSAGIDVARRKGDAHAQGEIQALVDVIRAGA